MSKALEQRFKNYRKAIYDQLSGAAEHFEIWRYLMALRQDYQAEWSEALTFFNRTTNAHGEVALMHLSRVLDMHKDSASLYNLLNFTKGNLALFSREAALSRLDEPGRKISGAKHVSVTSQDINNDISEVKCLFSHKLRDLRDKLAAHLDKSVALCGLDMRQFRLTVDEFEQMIGRALEILNKYTFAFDGRGYDNPTRSVEWQVRLVLQSIRLRQK